MFFPIFIPVMLIGNDNMEDIKEALYMHCKGKESFRIGSLESLRGIIDSVLCDSSPQHFRIVEACHFLANKGYLTIKNTQGHEKNIFFIGEHFVTPKFWKEMTAKEKGEQSQLQL